MVNWKSTGNNEKKLKQEDRRRHTSGRRSNNEKKLKLYQSFKEYLARSVITKRN